MNDWMLFGGWVVVAVLTARWVAPYIGEALDIGPDDDAADRFLLGLFALMAGAFWPIAIPGFFIGRWVITPPGDKEHPDA